MIQILENLKVIKDEELTAACRELNITYTKSPFPDSKVKGIILDSRSIFLQYYPNLKVISRVGVGTDNIDLKECKKREIKVYTTPCEELTNSVAEFTAMQILKFLRDKKELLYGKRIGIIGYGRIGRAVEVILGSGFESEVVWCDLYQKKYYQDAAYYYSLKDVLKSDIICVHVSGNKELIGKEEIERMEQNPIIVNMAREGCVNIKAICEAIKKERISGYITDVDYIDSEIAKYIVNGKILQTPHIASDTYVAREKMEKMAIENLIRGLKE